MDQSVLQLISEIGAQFGKQTRPNKDFIVKLLRQAASGLAQLEQPSLLEATKKMEAIQKIEAAIKPLKKHVTHGLLQHRDKDVKLLVAICVSEIFRVLAPDPPFEDKYLRDIFKLILSIFAELADTASPFFSRRAKILETVSRCKCSVIMLDIECSDLVVEMFNILFSVVREHHQRSLINDILSILTHILNEEVSQPLVDVVLQNLVKGGKETPSASSLLAISVIQACAEKLEPFVCGFLTSCILDRDSVRSDLKEFYHELIFKISQCAPHMLLAVIPNLTQELLTDQVDVRIKALNLIGKLFSLPEHHIAQNYRDLFIEFLKRFSDISAEVRVSALQCAKTCYMTNPSGSESNEVLSALEGRLLDFDDRVRTQAVIVSCDLARSNLKIFPAKLISQITQRLRDKKISVRKKALRKLMEVYRDYCNQCSEGHMVISDHLEEIPCKILMLCYDRECKEFRSQSLELVLAEDLFPTLLSDEERTSHWIHLYSLFTPLHVKALNSILSQKRRLQSEMQIYLTLKKTEKENCLEEKQNLYNSLFTKMAASFADPCKAEECFQKLNNMKDNNIFNMLTLLLDDLEHTNAQITRDKFLNMIKDNHQNFEFLRTLSLKCSYNIFSSAHVRCILDNLSSSRFGSKQFEDSSVRLLLAVTSTFPMLLRGSEEQFQMLLEGSNTVNDKMIEVLAKAGPHISVKLSEIYPFLKGVCLEGTRVQSKLAVSAIAALVDSSKQFVFSDLCKGLVDSLHSGRNTPTVLQSLGCLAQHSVSTFETQDGDITPFIQERIFQVEFSDSPSSSGDISGCSASSKLKIYGLKTLVKSFLPHHNAHVGREVNDLLEILLKVLQKGDTCDGIISRESDKACLRLAAAKSVLRLSRRWELHISPDMFSSTISIVKDESSFVRKSFIDKAHRLLKERAIPSRYACAYALAFSDNLKDLQEDSFKYMAEFVKEYSREARIRQTAGVQQGLITDFPAYIVVYLIHLLSHDKCFPQKDNEDEELYSEFCSPLFFVLEALVNASNVDGDMDVVKDAVVYLLCIFRAIKRAEDAVDFEKTTKLHILADIGFSFVTVVNQSVISSLHAPGRILLPSQLYRVNSKSLPLSSFNESFAKRVIQIYRSRNSLNSFTYQIDSTHSKRGRKYREDNTQLDIIKESKMNITSRKIVDLSVPGTLETQRTEKREITVECGRKRALSQSVHEPAALHECSKTGASKKSDISAEKELLSSCGSVTTKPTLSESNVPGQHLERNASFSEDNVGFNSRRTAEHCKLSETRPKGSCSSKETSPKGDALIGKRIELFSPIDRCYYKGTVEGYNSESNVHKIACDGGVVELLCLDSESWETISDCSLLEKVTLAEDSDATKLKQCDMGKHASSRGSKESVDLIGKIAASQLKSLANKKGEKRKKTLKTSVDTSASAVINIDEDAVARRTRRRKA